MPKKEPRPYEEWLADLVDSPPPGRHANIDEVLKAAGIENADGSWESLFERYTRREQRSRGRRGRPKAIPPVPLEPAPRASFNSLLKRQSR